MAFNTRDDLDLEMDADESNPGTGSFKLLQADEAESINPAIAQSDVSFESLSANLQVLQQHTNEHIAALQKSNAELFQKLKVALEEKDIWMTRCQRMESKISGAMSEGDNSTVDDLKYLEDPHQDMKYPKAENKRSTKEAAAGKGEGDVTFQPQADNSTANQHDMTLAGSKDSPDGVGPIKDKAPFPQQSTETRKRIRSLGERRGIEPHPLNDPGYVTGQARGGSFDAEAVNPEDIGDKAPSNEMFQYLSMNLQHDEYKPVLRNANFDEKRFGDIEFKYQNNAQECRFQAFKEWHMQLGRRATLRKLVDAMLVAELRNVTENFCEKFVVSFLVDEYDQLHLDLDDEPDTPFLCGFGQAEDQAEPPQKGPLENLLGPLMTVNYEEEFVPLIDGVVDFTDEQVQSFVKEQKWKNESKIFFKQELAVFNNKLSALNVFTCWSLTIHSIYDSNPQYRVVEKRKHIWKMMKSLRKSHDNIFAQFKQNKMFQGGVLGVNPLIEKEMLNRLNFTLHNDMKLLLQQRRDDGHDWRGVASKIPKVNTLIIENWKQKGDDKATDETLKTFGTSGKGTVQNLYEVLVDLDRGDVARLLED